MTLTNHALLPRLFPLFYLLLAVFVCYLCSFNGLYGQDAHEYLRQSGVVVARLQGLPAGLGTAGDAAFAGGYALMGGLLRYLIPNGPLAMHWVALQTSNEMKKDLLFFLLTLIRDQTV